MTKNITENINKTGIITKKIISLFIPICLLLISFSLVNCPDPGNDTSTPGNGNGNGNGGGQPDVLPQIIVEYRSAVINKDVTQSGFLLSLKDEPTGDVTVSITVRRSDGSGTATVNLGGSTATATETISFIFTQQNWNIPQEFKLVYGNPIDQDDPDPANVKIILYVTSTADTAYNDLTYYFSGNLTALELPNYSVHVHNAQSPEPEDTDATHTAENACTTAGGTWTSATSTCGGSIATENACTTAGGTWDGTSSACTITEENACNKAGGTWDGSACTVDDNRDIKVWFTVDPSVSAATTEVICARAGGDWDRSTTTCTVTEENACNTTGGTWDGTALTCTVTEEDVCTTAGGTWASGTSICTITAANACNTAGGFLDSSSNCISDQKDIMINYEVKAGSAAVGTDYIAPTSNTAIIKAGNSGVSISIPLVEDSRTTKNDEVDESFSVSITSVSTIGADVSIGDGEATVTIGDPNENAFYFFPNRPLVDGDTPYWECYHSDAGETFIATAAIIQLMSSTILTSPITGTILNDSTDVDGINVEPYETVAAVHDDTFLLGFPSVDRVAVKLGFDTDNNFSYDSRRDILNFACYGVKLGIVPSVSNTEGGAFGQLKFGQSYDRAE